MSRYKQPLRLCMRNNILRSANAKYHYSCFFFYIINKGDLLQHQDHTKNEVRRTLYLALVRPHLGYATQIWAPQSIEFIVKLECIQRRATKFILKLPYSSNISCKSRLQTLNLILICYWHELLDLTFFFSN